MGSSPTGRVHFFSFIILKFSKSLFQGKKKKTRNRGGAQCFEARKSEKNVLHSHFPIRFFLHPPLSRFRFPQTPLSGLCSTMASCSNPPPLSSPLSPSLQTRKLFAPLSYPRSGGPSCALHFQAKRGIRFSNPPIRLKVLCSADYDKGILPFLYSTLRFSILETSCFNLSSWEFF